VFYFITSKYIIEVDKKLSLKNDLPTQYGIFRNITNVAEVSLEHLNITAMLLEYFVLYGYLSQIRKK